MAPPLPNRVGDVAVQQSQEAYVGILASPFTQTSPKNGDNVPCSLCLLGDELIG